MSSSISVVSTPNAPAAIGPYVQAITTPISDSRAMLFASGCIPLDPKTGEIVSGGVEEQTKQALRNLKAVVTAGDKEGKGLNAVVKTTIFLQSMKDFAAVNAIYADPEFFAVHKPARSCVEVARLPKDVLVEIECIAVVAL